MLTDTNTLNQVEEEFAENISNNQMKVEKDVVSPRIIVYKRYGLVGRLYDALNVQSYMTEKQTEELIASLKELVRKENNSLEISETQRHVFIRIKD